MNSENKINTEGDIKLSEQVENIDLNKDKYEPRVMKYCDICHFPEEYCEISHIVLFKKQSQHLEAPVTEEKPKEGEEGKVEEVKAEAEKKQSEKKKPKENLILIELSKRGKRKHVTYVYNLEKFGLNLKDVAKLFSKKFACSSTVTKEENGQEGITLTGEFGYDIVDFLTEKFPNIKPEHCKVKEPKK